jgi:hypothetical protein
VPLSANQLQSLAVHSLWWLVYKVFSYFKHEADAGMPVHDVAKVQERTSEACNISIGSVQRIISEGNVAICISLSLCAPPAFIPVGHFIRCRGTIQY